MVASIKENRKTIFPTAMDCKLGLMAPNTSVNSSMVTSMAKDAILWRIRARILVASIRATWKALACITGLMAESIEETNRTTYCKDKVYSFGQTGASTTEHGIEIRCMVKASSTGLMAANIKGIGVTTLCMDMVSSPSPMVESTKGNTLMTKKRDKALSIGSMVASLKANGLMGLDMVKAHTSMPKEMQGLVYGRMALEYSGFDPTYI